LDQLDFLDQLAYLDLRACQDCLEPLVLLELQEPRAYLDLLVVLVLLALLDCLDQLAQLAPRDRLALQVLLEAPELQDYRDCRAHQECLAQLDRAVFQERREVLV